MAGRSRFLSGSDSNGVVALVLFLSSFRPSPLRRQPRMFSLPSGRECLLLLVAGLIWTAYTAGYSAYT